MTQALARKPILIQIERAGLTVMPFGNSVFMSSDDLELQRSFDRVRLHEPGPLSDGLPHSTGIGAGAPFGGDAAAHERVAALYDAMLQLGSQQILARAEEEPHRSHHGEDDAKLRLLAVPR
jgi:hypothetical protein